MNTKRCTICQYDVILSELYCKDYNDITLTEAFFCSNKCFLTFLQTFQLNRNTLFIKIEYCGRDLMFDYNEFQFILNIIQSKNTNLISGLGTRFSLDKPSEEEIENKRKYEEAQAERAYYER